MLNSTVVNTLRVQYINATAQMPASR